MSIIKPSPPFVYYWQYKADNVSSVILENPLLKSHLDILQNNGYLYYIGIHEGSNIRYAHSSDTVLALGLPKEVDYDNLPTGWKRRIIFRGESYPQVQAMESKLLKKAYDDHNWDTYLNVTYWVTHLFGGAGEDCPKYIHGKRGGENRHDPEVFNAYQKELYRKYMKDPVLKKEYMARKKRERHAREQKEKEEAILPFNKSIMRYLYDDEEHAAKAEAFKDMKNEFDRIL
tara:strand:- start:2549 stop:3238 length:690 start_codon:yes stop_codon:yes gene_type:complete